MTHPPIAPETLQRLAGSLLHFLWQGALIAFLTAIALRLLARRSAESRYAVSVSGLLLMTTAPMVTFIFYAGTGRAADWLLRLLNQTIAEAGRAANGLDTASLNGWIVLVWCAGVAVCLARLAAAWCVSRRLVRSAEPAVPLALGRMFARIAEELEIRKHAQLLVSVRIPIPAVIGWLRPVVLLPVCALTNLDEDQLRAVLAHELSHIRRHDFLVNTLQRCVESWLFYHPAVWWLSARIRSERELCCDDMVIRVCGDRVAYAEGLIQLERARISGAALTVAATGGPLTRRIHRILGRETTNRDLQSAAVAAAVVLLWMIGGFWQVLTLEAKTIPSRSAAAVTEAIRGKASVEPAESASPQKAPDSIDNSRGSFGAVLNSIAAIVTAQRVRSEPQQPLVSRVLYVQGPTLSIDLKGTISADGTKSPLSFAEVVLRPTGSFKVTKQGSTDAQGRFGLKAIPPGVYTLIVSRDGYVSETRILDLTRSELRGDLDLSLQHTGAIVGEVRDRNGEGMNAVPVRVLKLAYDSLGNQSAEVVSEARTDDRGYFRISGLRPGRYELLTLLPPDIPLRYRPALTEISDAGYMPTYYPGTTEFVDAARIEVKANEELSGLRFTMQWQVLHSIRGRVVTADSGQPPRNASFTIIQKRTLVVVPGVSQKYDSNDGTFEVRGVGSGGYWLQSSIAAFSASVSSNPSARSSTSEISRGFQRALDGSSGVRTSVEIFHSDIDNLRIGLGDLLSSIQGRVMVEGSGVLPGSLVVKLIWADSGAATGTYGYILGRLDQDGSGKFTTYSVPPARYRVSIDNAPPEVYLKRAWLDDAELTNDQPLIVTGRVPGFLTVQISTKAAQVNGVTQDDKGNTASNVPVVLVPDKQRERADLYRMATSDQNGRFLLVGVAPGQYRLFGWAEFDPYSYFDPDVMRRVESQGVPINIADGDRPSVNVKNARLREQ